MRLWELMFALPFLLMLYIWHRRPGIESALLTLAHLYSTLAHLFVRRSESTRLNSSHSS